MALVTFGLGITNRTGWETTKEVKGKVGESYRKRWEATEGNFLETTFRLESIT